MAATVRRRLAPVVRPGLRTPFLIGTVAAACIVLVLAICYAGDDAGSALDRSAAQWAEATRAGSRSAIQAALNVNGYGEARSVAVLVVLGAVICACMGRLRLATVAFAAPLASAAATTALKPLVDRTIHGDFLSYPSGHTAVATAFGIVVAMILVEATRAGRILALVLIALGALAGGIGMGWSQVLLDTHYLTDCVGGLATAVVVVLGGSVLLDRFIDRLLERRSGPTGA
ncbi:phosphatase PAP2 family protein [Pseudonocardia sp. GCM10023141]|uniref:phosphatase PAP2 family protein n=1 Tax=Pseudonocardia sp. GCM10023141 TaxID=3252653 RepID=UPI00360FD0AC